MTGDFIRYIVKCTQTFTDGNCYPKHVKAGQVIDVTEAQYRRLKQSGPTHFELIDKRVPNPFKEEVVEEEDISQLQYGIENVVDWRPEPFYAAQLARAAKK